MNEEIKDYLIYLYTRSKNYQESKNVQFDITLEQYLTLWSRKKSAMNRLNKQYEKSLLNDTPFQPKTNLVLTWKKDMCRRGYPMNVDTAGLYTFENSKLNCKLRKGEKKSEKAKLKLKKPKSETHKAAISASTKGKKKSDTSNMKGPKKPWTEERKAARRALIAERKAKKNLC